MNSRTASSRRKASTPFIGGESQRCDTHRLPQACHQPIYHTVLRTSVCLCRLSSGQWLISNWLDFLWFSPTWYRSTCDMLSLTKYLLILTFQGHIYGLHCIPVDWSQFVVTACFGWSYALVFIGLYRSYRVTVAISQLIYYFLFVYALGTLMLEA